MAGSRGTGSSGYSGNHQWPPPRRMCYPPPKKGVASLADRLRARRLGLLSSDRLGMGGAREHVNKGSYVDCVQVSQWRCTNEGVF